MNINKRIAFFSLYLAFLCSVPAWAGQGWYLLAPPISLDGANAYAPLSQWEYRGAYDSAKECNENRTIQYNNAISHEKEMENRPGGQYPNNLKGFQQITASWILSRCIASDDPRLKP